MLLRWLFQYGSVLLLESNLHSMQNGLSICLVLDKIFATTFRSLEYNAFLFFRESFINHKRVSGCPETPWDRWWKYFDVEPIPPGNPRGALPALHSGRSVSKVLCILLAQGGIPPGALRSIHRINSEARVPVPYWFSIKAHLPGEADIALVVEPWAWLFETQTFQIRADSGARRLLSSFPPTSVVRFEWMTFSLPPDEPPEFLLLANEKWDK